MITESTIYWVTRMTYLQTGVFVFGMVGVLVFLVALFIHAAEEQGFSWRFFLCSMLFGLLTTSAGFIPNTKEMCAIKVIPIIANNEEVQELPNKVVELANEWMEELKPKKAN